MPAATHPDTNDWYQGSPPPPDQELFTTSGRFDGSGLFPLRSVGAVMNCAEDVSAPLEQPFISQPFAAIHCADGATPILFTPARPTMVPIVCVPWSMSSHGFGCGQ